MILSMMVVELLVGCASILVRFMVPESANLLIEWKNAICTTFNECKKIFVRVDKHSKEYKDHAFALIVECLCMNLQIVNLHAMLMVKNRIELMVKKAK